MKGSMDNEKVSERYYGAGARACAGGLPRHGRRGSRGDRGDRGCEVRGRHDL